MLLSELDNCNRNELNRFSSLKMDIYEKPDELLKILEFHGIPIEDLYAAMRSNDLSDVVMTAYKMVENLGQFPPIIREAKSEDKSDSYREEGNSAYVAGRYHEALKFYNKALMFAPDCSMSMKLAYSNRSALLFKVSNYSACSKDIEMCLAMGCPNNITKKLLQRKADLAANLCVEKMALKSLQSFSDEFFKLNTRCNPNIPCANRDLQIIKANKSSKAKVVTTKDINVGTVLAVETTFSHHVKPNKMYYNCYYCNKVSLNLIPCDGCCFVMFCDKECKELCMREGHEIECKFIEFIEPGNLNCGPARIRLAVRAALKMRHMCKSWKEFISISHVYDNESLKNDVTDVDDKFPILTNHSIVELPYGTMFNISFPSAIVIYFLENVQSFLPKHWQERRDAIRAFSRVIVYLSVFANRTTISTCCSGVLQNKEKVVLMDPDIGYFSFVGKLRHSCKANTLAVGLNNKIALVAVRPIKCGTELTITYFGQFDSWDIDNVSTMMFSYNKTVCNCIHSNDSYELSPSQKNSFRSLNILEMDINFDSTRVLEIFPKLCNTMNCLGDLPKSFAYLAVYSVFCKCIKEMQHLALDNIVM